MYEAFLLDLIGGLAQAIGQIAIGNNTGAEATAADVLADAGQAAEGIRRRMASHPWSRVMPCQECEGTGTGGDPDGKEACQSCYGTGEWPLPIR